MKVLKSVSLILITTLLISCSTQNEAAEEGVVISGKVEEIVTDGWVRLEQIQGKKGEPVDTAEVNEDGSFKLVVKIDDPSFYRLNFNNRQYVTLVLTGEETEVEVNAEGNDARGYSEVSGSYDTQHLRDIDELVNGFNQNVRQLEQRAIKARESGDGVAFQAINVEYTNLAKAHARRLKSKVWSTLPSIASFYGLQQLDDNQDFSFFDSVAMELNKAMPNNYLVKNLVKSVSLKRKLAIGSEAPEINMPNPDGEIVSLSSLRGNYVLIDFWAAWCKPCRMENPNVVRVYNEYQDKNFEILGVSLDRTKDAWVKAIVQDGLPWKHVSDLKYFSNEAAVTYQISAIPATYLIDPEGKIIAKNLRGASLIAKLKEIFG